MFRVIGKIIRLCFYGLIILFGVTFAVSNRGRVDLTFYPFPYVASVPLFLFGIAVFFLGLFVGWSLGRVKGSEHRRSSKQAASRVTALENELGALRTERVMYPLAALPRK